jgi:hypothetical protein
MSAHSLQNCFANWLSIDINDADVQQTAAHSVYLSAACHHFDILLFKVRSGTKLTCFGASHAGVYATLPFRVLKSRGASHAPLRQLLYLSAS